MITFSRRLAFVFAISLIGIAAMAQQGSVDTTNHAPDVVVTTGDSATSTTFRVLNSANTELFRIQADGMARFGSVVPTDSPTRFAVTDNADTATVIAAENVYNGVGTVAALRVRTGGTYIQLLSHAAARTLTHYGIQGQGLGGWGELRLGGGNGLAIGTVSNTPIVFGTSDLNRLQIAGTGEIGIGTAPVSSTLPMNITPLIVSTNTDAGAVFAFQNLNTGSSTNSNAGAFVRASGDVAQINLAAHASGRTLSRWGVTMGGWAELLQWAGNGLAVGTLAQVPLILGTNGTSRMSFGATGGISMAGPVTVTGTLSATQVIGATYQDVAEWVDSSEKLGPGTVVVVARDHANRVAASMKAYDTRVAGVVSDKPGLILGVAGDSKAMIATTGRVRVHVDATAAPIEIGDLLVTSTRPGTAMKSIPVEVSGVEMHRPGTLIGKALEALPSGEGDILVLLSLQ